MKVSVHILAWNAAGLLPAILEILHREFAHEYEIIVTDNGSTDETGDILKQAEEYAAWHVKGIHNDHNLGISKGKNQGTDAADGDFILLLDGDILPVPNSVNCMTEFLIGNEDAAAIGFLPNKFTRQRNNSTQTHHESRCYQLHKPHVHNSHCVYYGLFRKEVFEKCRFCEEGAFGAPGYGWEDFDFYQQMRQAGLEQYAAGVNSARGRYYHAINSSIPHLGTAFFRSSTNARNALYKRRWPDA